MPKIMQNLIVLMEPSEDAYETPLKAGKIILNPFCIDEEAAFELSVVNYLQKSSGRIKYGNSLEFKEKRKVKGKAYSFFRSYFILRTLIIMNNCQLIILPKRTF